MMIKKEKNSLWQQQYHHHLKQMSASRFGKFHFAFLPFHHFLSNKHVNSTLKIEALQFGFYSAELKPAIGIFSIVKAAGRKRVSLERRMVGERCQPNRRRLEGTARVCVRAEGTL